MQGRDRAADELELLFWREQHALVLDLLHAVEVVGLMPDRDRETVERIVETLHAILREVDAERRRLENDSKETL